MARSAEKREKNQESRQKTPTPSKEKKRKPRGALFHSGDPTLAQRLKEEVYKPSR
jgi:hypothetical protein